MDIQAYIESGIIESYVLGLASDEEAAEVLQLIKQYPEVKQAIEAFEASLEQLALHEASVPPPHVKENLMQTLQGEFANDAATHTTTTKSFTTPVIPFDGEATARVKPLVRVWQYMAAACLILFIVSAAFNIYFYKNYQTATNQYQALLLERNSLQANNDAYKTSMQLMSDTATLKVEMKGVKGKENSVATVFWNKQTKDVYLLQNSLPQTPGDKQYQLWAIVDGKPVDAGVIENCDEALCKMKNIPKAQAFAITLEKKGGSPTPTLDAMFVMGGV